MTKNKKKNGNTKHDKMALVPLGPQSVANVLPRAVRWRSVTTEAFQANSFNLELVASTTSTQTYGPVGTKFADVALSYVLSEFYTPAEITRWDAYRIDEIQVYAYLIDVDCTIRVMNAIDMDDTSVIPWPDMRKRVNTSTAVLRLQNPMQLIAKWKPYPDYTPLAGESPSNKIGKPGEWFDTRASTQGFNGLKIHCAGASPLAANVNPTVGFLARAKVTWRAPN